MILSREKVCTGILEVVNCYCDMQGKNIRITDNIQLSKLGLDSIDLVWATLELETLFDITIPASDSFTLFARPFDQVVDYICALNPKIGTEGRVQEYMSVLSGGFPCYNTDLLNHVDSVLYGGKPKYTLYQTKSK